ncbi:MAG: glycoside hydrolase family 127 protein [Bryobacteraceae bacterium]|nr:glycoside hydrolase family 127 protein [Bryobacteraceae bacterium]
MPSTRRQLIAALAPLAIAGCNRGVRDDARLDLASFKPQQNLLRSAAAGPTALRGHLGRRILDCVENRILAQDLDRLVQPFRQRDERSCWQTEFWGKWALSAASAWKCTRDNRLAEALARSAHALIATQSEDGYIGNYAPNRHLEAWDIWGRKYTLLGLLACHEVCGEKPALDAARRLADHLFTEIGPGRADIVRTGNYRGMASSSILAPVVALYRATSDERYVQLAGHIVRRWSSDDGPQLIEKALAGVPVAERFPRPAKWFSWENGQKAYEMMSCYEGLLDLYRVTGTRQYLDAAIKAFENIRDTEILPAGSGSSRECWHGGARQPYLPGPEMMETCVSTTWMSLCSNLLTLTGDPRYADQIERTAYNALLGALAPDASVFAKYSPLDGVRSHGEAQCGMGIHCCTANGPRGLLLLPEIAAMQDPAGITINLFIDSEQTLPLPGGGTVRLAIETAYPASGAVKITLHPSSPTRFSLRLRNPAWSGASGYRTFDRLWRPGDHVEFDLNMDIRTIASGPFTAYARGPVLLARDSRGPDADAWITAQTPAGELCDFSSAGNTWDERSRYRVWLPPADPRSL